MRNIKIYSTVGASGTIMTDVTTLGQLKPLLSDRSINYSGMKMLVGETRNELNLDDAVLPTGDFKLYLMPEKTKSGSAQTFKEIAEKFADLAELFDELAMSRPTATLSPEDAKAFQDLNSLANQLGSAGDARPGGW